MDKAQAEKLIDAFARSFGHIIEDTFNGRDNRGAVSESRVARESLLNSIPWDGNPAFPAPPAIRTGGTVGTPSKGSMIAMNPIQPTGGSNPASLKDQALRDALGVWYHGLYYDSPPQDGLPEWALKRADQIMAVILAATPTGEAQSPTPADPLPLGEGQTANILKLVDEYAKELAYRENPCGMETIEDEERGTLVLAAKWSAVANAIEAITQGTPKRAEGEVAKGATAADLALMDEIFDQRIPPSSFDVVTYKTRIRPPSRTPTGG